MPGDWGLQFYTQAVVAAHRLAQKHGRWQYSSVARRSGGHLSRGHVYYNACMPTHRHDGRMLRCARYAGASCATCPLAPAPPPPPTG